ncbi:MAG: hypothetical protein LBP83_09390 [Dysgonamonadaceae bacterium]|jgi:hypothetical protein|nr:hypothetical protein [Dysgonamonadaceae bacterium]
MSANPKTTLLMTILCVTISAANGYGQNIKQALEQKKQQQEQLEREQREHRRQQRERELREERERREYEQQQREEQERLRLEEEARQRRLEAERQERLRTEREKQQKEEQYQKHIQDAGRCFLQKNYDAAKESYFAAITLKPEHKYELQKKIDEINDILHFLQERQYRVYDYEDFYSSDYMLINQTITENLKTILLAGKEVQPASISITCTVDTAGTTRFICNTTLTDALLEEKIKQLARRITLKQTSINGYTVASIANYSYSISSDYAILQVKKNKNGMESNGKKYKAYSEKANNLLHSAPMGNFTVQCSRITINSQTSQDENILKYKGTGGPSNALLSLLVPGLGDHRVTYGEKSGVGTALWTYGLLGAGIGCYVWSANEYEKYHKAIKQPDMDKHYQLANGAAIASAVCIATAGIIWVSDVIYVLVKGSKNAKEQKAWKRSHIGLYSRPEMNAAGLTYTVNF